MQLQPAHRAGRDEPLRFAHGLGPARRVDADERQRDVGVLRRELEDRVVGQTRRAAQRLVDGEDDARHLSRPVVFGQRGGVARGAALEVGSGLLVSFGLFAGVFKVNVDVEGDELLDVDRVCGHQRFGVAAAAAWRADQHVRGRRNSVESRQPARRDASAPPSD